MQLFNLSIDKVIVVIIRGVLRASLPVYVDISEGFHVLPIVFTGLFLFFFIVIASFRTTLRPFVLLFFHLVLA